VLYSFIIVTNFAIYLKHRLLLLYFGHTSKVIKYIEWTSKYHFVYILRPLANTIHNQRYLFLLINMYNCKAIHKYIIYEINVLPFLKKETYLFLRLSVSLMKPMVLQVSGKKQHSMCRTL
jgi:hypothetical protein